jgi:hypothetical protein
MTLGFETENLFLFEEGSRRLTLVDVVAWKAWWLDFEQLGLALSAEAFDQIAEAVRVASVSLVREAERRRDLEMRRAADAEAEEGVETASPSPAGDADWETAADEELAAAAQAAPDTERDPIELAKLGIARSAQALQALLPLRLEPEQLDVGYLPAPTGAFRPTRATFWVWASDSPSETFHAEDYEKGQIERLNREHPAEYIDFGARFDGIRAEQHYFPLNEAGGHAAISLPAEFASAARPDPLAPLPILDDYIGPGGIGVAGLATNFVDDATFGSECRLAIPLLRGGSLFLTLYLHFWFDDADARLATKLPAGGDGRARALLAAAGYRRHLRTEATGPVGERAGAYGEVWTRGDEKDVIHLYANLPGRETLYRGISGPILLPIRADGSFDTAARAALLAELTGPS